MADSAEDFVDDFLNAYPEFLTKNIIFRNVSHDIKMPSDP